MQFCHGRFLGERPPSILELRSPPREQAGGFDLSRHIGKLSLDDLHFCDGSAKRFTLRGVINCAVQSRLSNANSLASNADAACREELELQNLER